MGISGFFVVPHDAVLHRQVLELAVVPDGHVRADGAVLDGDILPDDARGNQPGIVNGIPLVDGGAADIVEFRAFPATFRHPREGGDPLAVRGRGGLSRHEFILSVVEGPEGRAHLTSGPPGPSGFHP